MDLASPFPIPPGRAAEVPAALATLAFVAAQAVLLAYAAHRWVVLARHRARRTPPAAPAPAAWPAVTVQLPVYNERCVVERLIAAAAALDYPRERLEIQVLDDSTDDTPAIAARAIAHHAACGVRIRHLRRAQRDGFKAGALAAGLARASGELLAVFDADFVPPPDFLKRMVPHFADPRVGMAQARWGHLNRERSALTAAQAVLLDAHFLLEHAGRMRGGLFFNFNGSAGIWRRECIERAGGWSHDTLTEDLDLSYRAQLAGWRFVFDPDVVVPAELPSAIAGFRSQQRRWVKGSIQTARKVLPDLLARPLPARVRAEAVFHLTANLTYPLLVAISLLLLPVTLSRPALPPAALWAVPGGVVALGIVPVALFLIAGQRAAGRRGTRMLADVGRAVALAAGISVNNARAALEGLGGRVGDWERTPKTGEAGDSSEPRPAYAAAGGARGGTELALALYLGAAFALQVASGAGPSLPFLALLVAGFAWVGWESRRVARATSG